MNQLREAALNNDNTLFSTAEKLFGLKTEKGKE